MILAEQAVKRWEAVLDHPDLPSIKDAHKRNTLAVVLENTARESAKERSEYLNEAAPANNIAATAGIDKYDPILISLVRRSLPNLMAYDICGVQPMTGPTGLVFAMKSRYGAKNGPEALFNEADTDFAGTGTHDGSNPVDGTYTTGLGMSTAAAEALGSSGGGVFNEMAFSIEKTTVTAKTRALKAEYTIELAQDLKAVHGLDADSELSNILAQEILAEINREVVRTIYRVAKPGAASTATPGTFDLDIDANGRWSVERFKGLLFQLEREANVVAQETRRGRGNFIVCSSDVASALHMAGKLDYAPALSTDLNVDDTGNTFVGVLNGKFRVYIDPYSANINDPAQFAVVGYKGGNQYDAGIFYCPYVPLQMVRAIDPSTFQPKMGFKTRYGMIANPFVMQANGTTDADTFTPNRNHYYRRIRIENLM